MTPIHLSTDWLDAAGQVLSLLLSAIAAVRILRLPDDRWRHPVRGKIFWLTVIVVFGAGSLFPVGTIAARWRTRRQRPLAAPPEADTYDAIPWAQGGDWPVPPVPPNSAVGHDPSGSTSALSPDSSDQEVQA